MNKVIIGSLVVIALAFGGMVLFLQENSSNVSTNPAEQTNVSLIDGKQVIEIQARGGYSPRVTVAQANVPTVINVRTKGTFDCSSALTVPAVGFRGMLPASGVTPIEIPPQAPGATIQGVCSMGMYSFSVSFRE